MIVQGVNSDVETGQGPNEQHLDWDLDIVSLIHMGSDGWSGRCWVQRVIVSTWKRDNSTHPLKVM